MSKMGFVILLVVKQIKKNKTKKQLAALKMRKVISSKIEMQKNKLINQLNFKIWSC